MNRALTLSLWFSFGMLGCAHADKLSSQSIKAPPISASTTEIVPGVFVTGSYFFIGKLNGEYEARYNRTDRRILHPGECFGITTSFQSTKINLPVTLELRVPSSPENFKYKDGAFTHTSISPDRHLITVNTVWQGSDGNDSIFWGVSEQDPLGHYELRLSLEGVEVADCKFEVLAENKASAATSDTAFSSYSSTNKPKKSGYHGYEKSRWGMPLSKVQDLYKGGFAQKQQNGETTYSVVRPVAGLMTGLLMFRFSKSGLDSVDVFFPAQGTKVNLKTTEYTRTSLASAQSIFKMLSERLELKYGKPDSLSSADKIIWMPNGPTEKDSIILTLLNEETYGTAAITYGQVPSVEHLSDGL